MLVDGETTGPENSVDDEQITNINNIGGRVYKHLYRAQSVQDHLRARENR
jgi:hypothetical protein